jgi:hypothetical protein
MELYDSLFADQDLEAVLLELEPEPGSEMARGRALLWEGRYEEAAATAAGAGEPWSSFLVAAARIRAGTGARRTLLALAEDPATESRVRLWAWTALRKLGERPSALHEGEILGVVLEVPVDDGVDVLAAYADGRVRFLGSADQLVVREAETTPAIEDMIGEGRVLLATPAAPRRLDPVAEGHVRLTGLSAAGVHQVEVPWSEVEGDAPYAALFVASARVLEETTSA